MARLIFQPFILLICLPLTVSGQQVRLTEIETIEPEYSRIHFSYFDSLLSEIRTYHRGEMWVKRVVFTFNEDYKQYVGVDVIEGNQSTHWYVRYVNGQVAEIAIGGLEKVQSYLFLYDKAGKLTSIKLTGKINGTWKYAFDGDNLSSITFKMPHKFPLAGKTRVYVAHDDHSNFWSRATKTMWEHRAILAIFFGDDSWSTNNPTHVTVGDKKEKKSIYYEYEYDSLGNPSRITIKTPGKEDRVMKLVYAPR